MKIGVLGRVVAWDDDGAEIRLRPQVRRLLGLLVATGTPVSLDLIAEYAADGRATGSAARTAAGRVRSVVGDRLVTVGSSYELVLGPDELDAATFADLRERAVDAPARERVAVLSAALDQWRSAALGDLADEPWAASMAARLERERADTVEDLAEALIECGRWTDAVALLEPHLADVPYEERPVGLLMRALAGSGRVTEALRCLRRFRVTLRNDIGVEPSRQLAALELDLLRETDPRSDGSGNADSGPALPMIGNLPDPLSSFVGRVDEVKELIDELDRSRLITLTGFGGTGKTRLAVEVAHEAADRFPDGCWFVDLAATTTTADVVVAAATALGVQTDTSSSPTASLVDHLHSRRALIVVDNCEHVLGPAASLVDELASGCPMVHILATSREHLGVDGERVHPVSGLDEPGAQTLFCDRAVGADDRFAPDEDDRIAIERICERLDRIPLAIELAAARTRSLTPVDVLQRLDDRFALLRGERLRTERHGTLAAAVDWSYDLLDESERGVFARLSIFPGDFDHSAAIDVGGAGPDGDMDGGAVDAVLESLVSKSLVISDRSGRHTRYRLLETLREFGRARLAEQCRTDAIRRRYQLHYLSVATEIRALDEPSAFADMAVFAMVRRDWHNFRAAVASALDDGVPELAAGIALLPPVYYLFLDEHAEWMDAIVDRLPEDHPLACISHAFATLWCTLRGDNDEAFRKGERGLELEDIPGGDGHRMLWWAIGEAHLNTGDPVEALAAGRRALDVVAVDREQRDIDVVNPLELCCLAALAVEPEAVQGYADRLAAVAAAAPSEVNIAIASNGTGFATLARGDTDAAIEHFRTTAEVTRGMPHMQGEALKNLAVAASWADTPAAEAVFVEALDRAAHNRMWSFVWVVLEALAIHWHRHGRTADAAVVLGYLERHGLAFGALVNGRADVATVVGHTTRVADQREQGAAMTRDELVAFACQRLGAPDRRDLRAHGPGEALGEG